MTVSRIEIVYFRVMLAMRCFQIQHHQHSAVIILSDRNCRWIKWLGHWEYSSSIYTISRFVRFAEHLIIYYVNAHLCMPNESWVSHWVEHTHTHTRELLFFMTRIEGINIKYGHKLLGFIMSWVYLAHPLESTNIFSAQLLKYPMPMLLLLLLMMMMRRQGFDPAVASHMLYEELQFQA